MEHVGQSLCVIGSSTEPVRLDFQSLQSVDVPFMSVLATVTLAIDAVQSTAARADAAAHAFLLALSDMTTGPEWMTKWQATLPAGVAPITPDSAPSDDANAVLWSNFFISEDGQAHVAWQDLDDFTASLYGPRAVAAYWGHADALGHGDWTHRALSATVAHFDGSHQLRIAAEEQHAIARSIVLSSKDPQSSPGQEEATAKARPGEVIERRTHGHDAPVSRQSNDRLPIGQRMAELRELFEQGDISDEEHTHLRRAVLENYFLR